MLESWSIVFILLYDIYMGTMQLCKNLCIVYEELQKTNFFLCMS